MENITITGGYDSTALGAFFLENMFLIVMLIFLALVITFLFNVKHIKRNLSGINKTTWLTLSLIIMAGFALRNAQYEYGQTFDGIQYPTYAATWLDTGTYLKACFIGNLDDCGIYYGTLVPAGFPFIIILLYMAFGMSSMVVMVFTGIIGSVNILITFMIAYLLFKREDVGLYSAIVHAFLNLDILMAGTASLRPVSLFFMELSLLSFLLAMRDDRVRSWLFFALTLSFTVYVKQENSIILLPIGFLFFLNYKEGKEFFSSTRFLIPAALFLISQIPVQHWIITNGGIPLGYPAFSASYMPRNLPHMMSILFWPAWGHCTLFSPAVSIIFFSSLLFLYNDRYRPYIASLWIWVASLLMLYSSFFHHEGFVRFMTPTIMAYSLLAGLVIQRSASFFRIRLRYGLTLTSVLLLLTSGVAIPSTMFKDNRLDEPALKAWFDAIESTPPNCTIIMDSLAVSSDALPENQRRWIITHDMGFYTNLILEELNGSECIMLIQRSEENTTNPYLNLLPYFEKGGIAVYKATLK